MKLLCAARVLPFPTDTGHAWRCLGLLRALALEHEVTFLTTPAACATAHDEREARELLGNGSLALFAPQPLSPNGAAARLRRWTRAGAWQVPPSVIAHHDVRIAKAMRSAAAAHDAVVLLDNAVTIYWQSLDSARRTVADIHNVAGWSIAQVDTSDSSIVASGRARVDVALMRKYERRWLKAMDAVTVTSPDEDGRLQNLYGRRALAVIPSTVDPPARPQRQIGAKRVGWVGLLGYGPNRDGLLRFVREAWTPLGDAGWELVVIGGGEGSIRSELTSYPGVRVLGFVDSLGDVLGSLGAAVIPLWEGAGVKLKTATFMSAGIPVVSTSVGLEGIDNHDDKVALVGEDPLTLAHQLRELLRDDLAAEQIGDAGRALILRELSWEAIGRRFVSVVEHAVESPRVAATA